MSLVAVRKGEQTPNLAVVVFLAVMAGAVRVAYARSLPGLNASGGIIPDIRYLSPLYLPAGLLGVYSIWRLGGAGSKRMALSQIGAIAILTPALLLALMLFQPYGGKYAGYAMFFTRVTFVLLAVVLVLMVMRWRSGVPAAWVTGALALLIAAPFAWQMMMVFLYSVAKFNGYPLWIPVVEMIYQNWIGVSGLEGV